MKKSLTIASAVAAALACSSAFALNPTTIASDIASNSITIVYISGSSAFRDEMANSLSTLCASGTLDTYGGDATGDSTNDPNTVRNAWDGYATSTSGPFYSYNGPDFRGYACTLVSPAPATAPALSTLAGSDILVYYRAEGGSVWGVVPVAAGAKIQHLVVPSPSAVPAGQKACYLFQSGAVQDNGVAAFAHAGSNGDGHHWLCSVPMPLYNTNGATATPAGKLGWWLPIDNWNGGTLGAYPDSVDLTADVMTYGMSDVEPAALNGTNYPKNYKMADGTSFGLSPPASVSTLTVTPLLQQMFGIIVDTGGTVTSNITTLSRQSVLGIFSGQYTNWSQVPEAGGASAAITVCRRDPGSGTETMNSIFFGNVYCGPASSLEANTPFANGNVVNGTINGPGILQFATTGDVQACVGANTNSIGLGGSWSSSPPAGAKWIQIDGETPSQTALLTGAWHDWTEVVAAQPSSFNASTNQGKLVTGLIQNTSDANGGAVKSNTAYAFIPNQADAQAGDNTPSVANLSKFIALSTKGGDTCKEIVQPSNTN